MIRALCLLFALALIAVFTLTCVWVIDHSDYVFASAGRGIVMVGACVVFYLVMCICIAKALFGGGQRG